MSKLKKALSSLKKKIIIIDINDKYADQSKLEKIGELEYEKFLNSGDENFNWKLPDDEWQALVIELYIWNNWKPKRCCIPSQRLIFDVYRKCNSLEYA